jgi:cholesterol transport system auxiliary component
MKNVLLIAVLLLLAGCATRPNTAPKIYDFGLTEQPAQRAVAVTVLEMRAPEWLDGTQMLYRLAYEDPRALSPYGGSRWAGPPAAMLTLRMRQQFGSAPGTKCTLATQLAEFSQTFDSASSSRALLQVQATLGVSSPAPQKVQREFRLEGATPSADAAGGAAAFSQLASDFVRAAEAWIDETGFCSQD